ncbi:MAG: methyltransferase domain-containing protein, partial [Actinomycetes bacterium]
INLGSGNPEDVLDTVQIEPFGEHVGSSGSWHLRSLVNRWPRRVAATATRHPSGCITASNGDDWFGTALLVHNSMSYYLTMTADESLAAVYDAFAQTYDANRDAFDMTGPLRDLWTRLPTSGDLLDLGCGAGEPVARDFLSHGWRVTGVDFSHGMLELAAQYVPAMRRIQSDMRDVEFPAASFDAVTAFYSLIHVSCSDHPALFARIRTWLRPGGTLLFTYATRDYTGHDRFSGTKTFLGRELFYSHTTPQDLFAQLSDAGLVLADAQDRAIGGETFLWVTASRSDG